MKAAARLLGRSRGFAVAVILTLGAAMALQGMVMAVVNAYLVRSLPYPDVDRLYTVVYAERPQNPPPGLSTLDWNSLADVVEHPIAWDLDMFYMMGAEYPEGAPGAWVTPGFMQGLGIRAALGRTFSAEDFAAGAPQVALISHDLWQRRFGGDSSALGAEFTAYVSDRPADPERFTIVGVLPSDFWHVNTYTEVLTPLRAVTYPYYVRLPEGVPPSVAANRIEALARDAGLTVPTGWRVELRPTHGEYVRATRPMLLAVGAAVTLVFLIACANVALLAILRGLRRRREIAVRIALGAGAGRVARLLFAESAILLSAAGALGVALAWLALRTFGPIIEMQLGRRVPGGATAMTLDTPVLIVVLASALLVALVLTFAPLAGTGALASALRERRAGGGIAGRRVRSALVAAEVAGSLALLVGCGLTVRTVQRLLDVDLGIRAEGVVSTTFAVREHSYPDAETRVALYDRLIAALQASDDAGMRSVALSSPSPLASYTPVPISVAGSPAAEASVRVVTAGYFDVLGIAVAQGRGISEADRLGSDPVAVVSASLARRLWPALNPIGRTVQLVERQLPSQDTILVTRTVVGVVADVRQSATDRELEDMYVPLSQAPGRFAAVVGRSSAHAASVLPAVRRTVRAVDAEIAVGALTNLGEAVARQLMRPRFLAGLFSAFGVFAATLGIMGLYAVIAYAAKQREHEVAVRMAVGADRRRIVSMFLREGAVVVLGGVAVGVVGAVAIGRVLESQLFGVRGVDVPTIAGASLLLVVAAMGAIWWPSRRASRTDPIIALRDE